MPFNTFLNAIAGGFPGRKGRGAASGFAYIPDCGGCCKGE